MFYFLKSKNEPANYVLSWSFHATKVATAWKESLTCPSPAALYKMTLLELL